MSRSRNWCFTDFRTSEELRAIIYKDGYEALKIAYCVWGEEKGSGTGRDHLQGYVQFSDAVTMRTCKRRFGSSSLHVEQRKGSADQAIGYCLKYDDGRSGGAADPDKVVHEYGVRPKPGKRTDLQVVRDHLGAGGSIRGLLRPGPGSKAVGYQAIRYAQLWTTYYDTARTVPPKVEWLWGPTGTGKTRAASAEATASYGEDVWWSNGGVRWFCGYDGHKAVILDDFRPDWCKLHVLLRLLDRYAMRVEVKGSTVNWRPVHIYITCPLPPSSCYLDQGEDVEQLVRRVHVVREFRVGPVMPGGGSGEMFVEGSSA